MGTVLTSGNSRGSLRYSIVPLLTVGVQYCTSTVSRDTPGSTIVPLLTVGVLLGTVLYIY